MKFHLDNSEGLNLVNGYDGDGIVVNRRRHEASLILSPQQITERWPIDSAESIDAAHCERIAEHGAEVVLLGTGRRHVVIDLRWLAWFGQRGMGLEVMDTRAACRTYNILAAEGRRVVAALIVD